jgi:calcineurin-like phosphoesterase family protein
MPVERTFALGDIHGCAVALETILPLLQLRSNDTLIVLGDAIDRGPDSRGVIDKLLEIRDECRLITILGNHEQMLLDVIDGMMPRQGWLIHGGSETLDSYGDQASPTEIPEQHLAFIRTWTDYYETSTHFFAHGNYLEQIDLARQPWGQLRWEPLHQRLPEPHQSGKIAVLGHTANRGGRIVNLGHLVCIDTCCHGGAWLTALEPATGQVWQTNDLGDKQQAHL